MADEHTRQEETALHDAITESVPKELQPAAESALEYVLTEAKARPLLALIIAALIGFVFAAITSK